MIIVNGCFGYRRSFFHSIRYPIGTIVYLCISARKGMLEKLEIKDVKLTKKMKNLYQDSYNFLYNEWELCTFEEASVLYQEYFSNLESEIAKAKEVC